MSLSPLILVIDDDEDLRELLTELLRSRGYRARFAASGHEVDEALLGERPTVAVLDWFIPESSGEQIARQLTERAIPFVLSSGAAELKERASALGAVAYLEKPFGIDQLFAAIEGVFREGPTPPAVHL